MAAVPVAAALLLGGITPSARTEHAAAQGEVDGATSVIFMMGDGMGEAQRNAGQLLTVGAEGQLAMDALPYSGEMGTDSVDPETFVTDSAAAATSMASGVKTVNGAVGVDADGNAVATIAELAKQQGKSVGLVTTSQVTDASPAAFAAHVASRRDQSEIARQYIEDFGVDVILGGGEDRWLPEGEAGAFPDQPAEDPEEQSQSDKGNLIDRAQELGYGYVSDADALDAAEGPKLLGLFANEEMFQQFPEGQGDRYEPVVSLDQMTQKAIDILSQNPNGFFLFVEEEAIDEMGHANNTALTLKGVEELDRAVRTATGYANQSGDTLVIVTADHECGGMTIESLDDPEFPDESGTGGTAATPVAAEVDSATISGEDGPFSIAGSDYEFIIDWTTTGHTAVPVPVTAMGPGAEMTVGKYENTQLFAVMTAAMGIDAEPGGPMGTPAGATPTA